MSELVTDTPDGRSVQPVLAETIVEMMGHRDYPCLGARSVLRRNRATLRVYRRLADPAVAPRLLVDLQEFASRTDPAGGFASFVAIFRAPMITDEAHFERLLWSQLGQLHDEDREPWSEQVSPDPDDKHFAYSLAGTPYFVVGLHPMASRDARRTPAPTLVFNLHEQFEALRASGHFPRMRDQIRERDQRLQGTINPMVADYGEHSEARQYSGRRVEPGWRAPFKAAGT